MLEKNRNGKYLKNKGRMGTILFLIIINVGLSRNIFYDTLFSLCFALSIVIMAYFQINEYKSGNVSLVYLFAMNLLALIHVLADDGIIFDFLCQCIQVISYLIVLVVGLIFVWIMKYDLKRKFIRSLLITIATIIISYGGLYTTLYSMYFGYGLECFEIDTGMEYSEAALSEDFIFYSADACFGTNLSNITIRYFDYSSEELQTSEYKEKFDGSYNVMRVAKWASLSETIVFAVYISMIIVGYDKDKEGKSNKTILTLLYRITRKGGKLKITCDKNNEKMYFSYKYGKKRHLHSISKEKVNEKEDDSNLVIINVLEGILSKI